MCNSCGEAGHIARACKKQQHQPRQQQGQRNRRNQATTRTGTPRAPRTPRNGDEEERDDPDDSFEVAMDLNLPHGVRPPSGTRGALANLKKEWESLAKQFCARERLMMRIEALETAEKPKFIVRCNHDHERMFVADIDDAYVRQLNELKAVMQVHDLTNEKRRDLSEAALKKFRFFFMNTEITNEFSTSDKQEAIDSADAWHTSLASHIAAAITEKRRKNKKAADLIKEKITKKNEKISKEFETIKAELQKKKEKEDKEREKEERKRRVAATDRSQQRNDEDSSDLRAKLAAAENAARAQAEQIRELRSNMQRMHENAEVELAARRNLQQREGELVSDQQRKDINRLSNSVSELTQLLMALKEQHTIDRNEMRREITERDETTSALMEQLETARSELAAVSKPKRGESTRKLRREESTETVELRQQN